MKIQRVPHNFCGLPERYSAFEKARVVVIPAPYDATTSYVTGSRRGPEAIIAASMNMEQYDEELRSETFRVGIHTQDQLEPVVSSPEAMVAAIGEAVGEVLDAKKFPVLLGGEHSVTAGAFKALDKRTDDLTILHFDAHADLRDAYEGTPYSHACVGRRALELGSLVQVGIRSMSSDEAAFLRDAPVATFMAMDIESGRVSEEDICARLGKRLYITIDLDVFDPSIMPATGTPEPGGLDWYRVLSILRAACRGREIVGFDVVELCPMPYNVAPDFLAAKLVYRLLGYIFYDGTGAKNSDR
jgi:agmatinase